MVSIYAEKYCGIPFKSLQFPVQPFIMNAVVYVVHIDFSFRMGSSQTGKNNITCDVRAFVLSFII